MRFGVILVAVAAAIFNALPANAWPWGDPDWVDLKRTVRNKYPQLPVVTTPELAELLRDDVPKKDAPKKPLLIDARAQVEYDDSQLSGALHAESTSAAEAVLKAAHADPSSPIVVYCSVGYRSAAVADGLRQRGYKNVSNYEGSIFEWANSGLPVFRGSQKVNKVHPYDRSWGTLLKRDLWSREP